MKTTVDYLRFRARHNPWAILEAIRPAFGTAAEGLSLGEAQRGVEGWKYRRALRVFEDIEIGFIDYDGPHMREWNRLDMAGGGCDWVHDWTVIETLPQRLSAVELRRLDIALTTVDGSITHERVLAAHAAGRFCSGGRGPEMRYVCGSHPRAGRTVYIGQRKASPKFLRCYEKGWEMLKDVPFGLRDQVTSVAMDRFGHVDPAKVYRVEVELKAVERAIRWEAVASARDESFAGAYPFCADLLPEAQPIKPLGIPEVKARMELAAALEHCRMAYGAKIRAAVLAFGGDTSRVMEIITADQPCHKLVAAGVLTVDHV